MDQLKLINSERILTLFHLAMPIITKEVNDFDAYEMLNEGLESAIKQKELNNSQFPDVLSEKKSH